MTSEGGSLSDFAPLVSVIVPNYNHASLQRVGWIAFSIKLSATSNLSSLTIVRRTTTVTFLRDYANRFPMQLVLNEKNSGSPFAQWRRGALLAKAKGRYLWIAESDDVADPKLLETLVNVVTKHPQVGLAYCQSYRIDANDKRIDIYHGCTDSLDAKRWKSDFVNSGTDEVARWLIQHNTIPNAKRCGGSP